MDLVGNFDLIGSDAPPLGERTIVRHPHRRTAVHWSGLAHLRAAVGNVVLIFLCWHEKIRAHHSEQAAVAKHTGGNRRYIAHRAQ
jgi:hypothetical protein